MRLLTWNVQWCRGVDGRVDCRRIAAEIRRLADPDVACLQEIAAPFPDLPGSAGEDQPEELGRLLNEYSVFFAAGVDLPQGSGRKRFGNLILSRLPVGRVLRHSLPWPASQSPSMPRVAVEALIEAPSGPLRVTTTHLEYYLHEHRAAQVGRLRALHAEACADHAGEEEAGPFAATPPRPSAIVCGDFNMPPDDPLHAVMTSPMPGAAPQLVDAWRSRHPGKLHPPTFRAHEREEGKSPYCCDYVFVSEDLAPRLRSVRIDGETQASDHQPVIVELD